MLGTGRHAAGGCVVGRRAHESLELVGKYGTRAKGAPLRRRKGNNCSAATASSSSAPAERGEPAPNTQPTCPIVVALQQRHQPPTGPNLPV